MIEITYEKVCNYIGKITNKEFDKLEIVKITVSKYINCNNLRLMQMKKH